MLTTTWLWKSYCNLLLRWTDYKDYGHQWIYALIWWVAIRIYQLCTDSLFDNLVEGGVGGGVWATGSLELLFQVFLVWVLERLVSQHTLDQDLQTQWRTVSPHSYDTVRSAYKEPIYKEPVYKEPIYKELPFIRNWFSFPNLYQGTISLYLYKELQL